METINCISCGKKFKTKNENDYYCSKECQDNQRLIFDHEKSYESEVVCPYCGHEHMDSWEYSNDEYDDFKCCSCERKFIMVRNIEVTYSSSPHLEELLKMKEEQQ